MGYLVPSKEENVLHEDQKVPVLRERGEWEVSLSKTLYNWAIKAGFSKKTARDFFKTLGEYITTNKAPKWWIERCKELKILDEDGKILLEAEKLTGTELILLGLVWEGIIIRTEI